MLLNSSTIDETQVVNWLDDTNTNNIEIINKGLYLLKSCKGIPVNIKQKYEASKLTNFHKLLANASEFNNSGFINLIYSNFRIEGMYLVFFIYVKKCLLDEINKINKSITEVHTIINILETLKDKNTFNELEDYLIKLYKPKGLLYKITMKTAKYKRTIIDSYLLIIREMMYHISSGNYLIKNPYDMFFYNYLPYSALRHFSRDKYPYLNLELTVFNIVKNRLVDIDKEVEMNTYLSNKRDDVTVV